MQVRQSCMFSVRECVRVRGRDGQIETEIDRRRERQKKQERDGRQTEIDRQTDRERRIW